LNTTLTPHSIVPGDACFAYFNKIWGIPRIVGGKVMMPADLKRLHKYMLDIEHIDHVSDEMRAVVESEWPELAHSAFFFFFFVLLAVPPALALNLPALSGRVVDEANILDQTTRMTLIQKLADLEAKTTDQLVVVTLKSLQGTSSPLPDRMPQTSLGFDRAPARGS